MLQSSFRGFDYAPAAKEELLCIRPAEYAELTNKAWSSFCSVRRRVDYPMKRVSDDFLVWTFLHNPAKGGTVECTECSHVIRGVYIGESSINVPLVLD